jgi:hypothetical protein
MFAIIRASNHGFKGRHRAGRFFTNGESVKMEIIPDAAAERDPSHDRPIEHFPLDKDGKPSMTQITRSGFEQIKADLGGLNVLSDEESQTAVSQAAFDEAKRRAVAAEAKAAALEIELAALRAEMDELTAPKVPEAPKGGKGSKAKDSGE